MSPVPTFLKNNVVETGFSSPTNVPVVPRPTLTVAIPIKSSLIFATNKLDPSARVLPTPTLVSSCIIIPEPLTVPIPVKYVT